MTIPEVNIFYYKAYNYLYTLALARLGMQIAWIVPQFSIGDRSRRGEYAAKPRQRG